MGFSTSNSQDGPEAPLPRQWVCRREHRFSLVVLVELTNLIENRACQEKERMTCASRKAGSEGRAEKKRDAPGLQSSP